MIAIQEGATVVVETGCEPRNLKRGERLTVRSVVELGEEYSHQVRVVLASGDRSVAWYARHKNRLCDPVVRLNDGNPLHVLRVRVETGTLKAVLADARRYPHVARAHHALSFLKSRECPSCRDRVSPTSWEIHAVLCPVLITASTPDLARQGFAITRIERDAGVRLVNVAHATDHAIGVATESAPSNVLTFVLSYDAEGQPLGEDAEIDRIAIEIKRAN